MFRFARLTILLILTFTAFALPPTQAQFYPDTIIEQAWATPCADDNPTLTADMFIDNANMDADTVLIGVAGVMIDSAVLTPIGTACESAQLVPSAMTIAAGEAANLADFGLTLALIPTEDYEIGDPLSLRVNFDVLDDNGEEVSSSFSTMIGLLVLDEAPEPSPLLFHTPWTRPTVFEPMDGMDMSKATEEAMDDMDHMGMDGMMMDMSGNHAVYGQLINRDEATLTLVGGSTDVAEFVEIHETVIEDDVAMMTPIPGLELAVDETLEMAPGGFHIMLVNLNTELRTGDAIALTLFFEYPNGNSTELTLAVPVYDAQLAELEMLDMPMNDND